MAGGKGLRTPEIDHQGAVVDQRRGVGGRERGRRWNASRARPRTAGPLRLISFIRGKVRRRLRQIAEDGIHESRLRGCCRSGFKRRS